MAAHRAVALRSAAPITDPGDHSQGFGTARPCDRKANRPPGQAALTERAALMGPEGLEQSADLDQLPEVIRFAFPPATAAPGAGVTA